MSSESGFPDRYMAPRPSTRLYLDPQLTTSRKRSSSPTKSPKKGKKTTSGTKPQTRIKNPVGVESLRSIKNGQHTAASLKHFPAPASSSSHAQSMAMDIHPNDTTYEQHHYASGWKHKKFIMPPDMPPLEQYIDSIYGPGSQPMVEVTTPKIPDIPDSEFAELFETSLADSGDWCGYMHTLLSESVVVNEVVDDNIDMQQ